MKHMNIPKDSGVWAVGNTIAQDLKLMAVLAAFCLAMVVVISWCYGFSPAKLFALILGA